MLTCSNLFAWSKNLFLAYPRLDKIPKHHCCLLLQEYQRKLLLLLIFLDEKKKHSNKYHFESQVV